jgi:hypothetical protein
VTNSLTFGTFPFATFWAMTASHERDPA